MHERGVSFQATIERRGGTHETLLDQAFDFNNQFFYDTPAVLRAGDKVITSCNFNNTSDHAIFIGENSTDEMCIAFVTAWPAGALVTGAHVNGAEGCAQ